MKFKWPIRIRKGLQGKRKMLHSSRGGNGLATNYLASHLPKADLVSAADDDSRNSERYAVPAKARQFDLASAAPGDRLRAFMAARTTESAKNGAAYLVANSLAFAVIEMASVVALVNKNRHALSHPTVENVYDWVNLQYRHTVCPLLNCIRDDILPEFDRVQHVDAGSMLSRKRREDSFLEVHAAIESVLQSCDAFIPQLPAGERAFVLVYAFYEAEEKIAVLLWAFRKLSKANVYSPRSNSELLKLEQHAFTILSLGADANFSLDMRGTLTAWMSDQEFRGARLRIGIRPFDISAQRQLQKARQNFSTKSVLGRFPVDLRNFLDSAIDLENADCNVEAEGKLDPDIVHRLNIMTAERMMMKINGNINIESAQLEDVSGVVHDNDITLYYGNYRQYVDVAA